MPERRIGARLAVRLSVSLATSALFLGALFANVAPAQVLEALARVRPEWLTLALAGVALAFALRAQRWLVMLRRCGTRVRFRDAAVPLIGAAALSNLLPSGTGKTIRVIALQSFASPVTSRQLATLGLEKVFDICALAAIGVATLALAGLDLLGRGLIITAGLLGAALAAAAILRLGAARRTTGDVEPPELSPAPSTSRVPHGSARSPSRPALWAALAGLTLGGWLAEGLTAVAAAKALDLRAALPTAALAVPLGGLSRFAPSLPGHLGVFDYFVASAATTMGASKAAAVAYALLVHALIWIPTTVTGWLLLVGADRIGVLRGAAPRPARGA
jgi:uncharacterized membrane protein YbhN (UPF0104 family)